MLDIGWSELILIGIVALIVVGPKDLPRMFHTLGRFTGKLRAMGREFQMAMNDAAKSSGLDEVRKDMNDIVSKKNLGLDALETAAKRFETWDPTRPTTPATASAAVAAASAAAAAEATADEIAADEALGLHETEKPLPPASGAAPAKSDT
ncbi:Sec-independent protein translocase protein TatB [Gemmobacter aquaticus]|jgi:sec-independent protein translocase protein TatB|uniref:Sec-independent protein translocase protein TatB n=1 Tax=Gemmobacter aquaticus TaxID=490185 RepID=A0A917YIR4_9RHOB|nr:Sec-independent protein translocase protein TatB [Gemmobacter aquaticus]GGO27117.1 Sec-independent protein translocase protein TatB [Gemmobacter aquaticus]